MIKLDYTKTAAISTIKDVCEVYIDYLENFIVNVRTNPNEIIFKVIASRLLHKAKKILLHCELTPILRKKTLKLPMDEALILMRALLHYQNTVITPGDPNQNEIEKLKFLLDPQTL